MQRCKEEQMKGGGVKGMRGKGEDTKREKGKKKMGGSHRGVVIKMHLR